MGDKLISEDIIGNQKRQHSFMLYSTFSAINDFERLSNSGALLELTQWLSELTDIPVTQKINGIEHSGVITNINAENGMLYTVPQENYFDGIQYQLQIVAQYTLEI